MKVPLINFKEYQKNVFWNSYSQSELYKGKTLFDDEEEEDLAANNNWFQLWKIIKAWSASFYQAFHSKNDVEFWKYYIHTTNRLSLNILALNLITFIVFFIGTYEILIHGDDNDKNGLVPALSYMAFWFVQSFICFFFFLMYNKANYPTFMSPFAPLIKFAKFDFINIWDQICKLLICCRLFLLAQGITYSLVSSDSCYGIYMTFENDRTINYPIFATIIDLFQSFVFSALPVPSNIILFLSTIHTIEICLRCLTCRYRIHDVYKINVLLILTMISFSISLVIFNVIYSLTFERSVYSTYQNIKREIQATKENSCMVDMLTREIKVPIQTIHRVVSKSKSKFHFRDSSLEKLIRTSSESIYLNIDLTVFILKIMEGRYEFDYRDEIDLNMKCQFVIELLQSGLKLNIDLSSLIRLQITLDHNHYSSPPKRSFSDLTSGRRASNNSIKSTILDNIIFRGDKLCIKSLLYYSFIAIFALLGEDNLTIENNPNISTFDIDVTNCKKSSIGNHFTGEILKFEITWDKILEKNERFSFLRYINKSEESKNKELLKDLLSTDRYNILTAAMTISHKIVSTYNGTWELYYNKLVFVCPGIILAANEPDQGYDLKEDNDEHHKIIQNLLESESDPAQSIRSDPMSYPPEENFNFFEFYKYIASNICLLITEPQIEDFVLDFTNELSYENISINSFHAMNNVELKVYSIILVQTIDACKQLRARGFEGNLVLCSEQFVYLNTNKENNELFSFGLSLPCHEFDRKRFVKWLKTKFRAYQAKYNDFDMNNPSFKVDEIEPSKIIPNTLKIPILHALDRPLLKRFLLLSSNFFEIFNFFSYVPLPQDVDIHNYAKWKCINPGNQLYHHSQTYLLFIAAIFIFNIIETLLRLFGYTYLFFSLLPLVFLWVHRVNRFANFFEQILGYNNAWTIAGSLILLLSFITFSSEFIRFHPLHPRYDDENHSGHKHYYETYKPIEQCDFNAFLHEKFGSYPGIYSILTLINLSVNMKSSSFLISWPLCIPVILIIAIRNYLIITIVISKCFGAQTQRMTEIVLIFFTLTLLRVVSHIEQLYRREFIKLNLQIFSKDLVHKVVNLSNKALFSPLNSIQDIQIKLLDNIHKIISHGKMVLDEEFLEEISILNRNIIITRELIFRMNYLYYFKHGCLPADYHADYQSPFNFPHSQFSHLTSDDLTMESPNNSNNRQTCLIANMKAHFLKDIIYDISSHFELLLKQHDLQVKIFCYCDSSLSLIRFDSLIFQAILSCSLRKAVQRIQATQQHFGQSKLTAHEILIWVKPYDFTLNSCNIPDPYHGQLRFSDPKLMDILILDTGVVPNYTPKQALPHFTIEKDYRGFKTITNHHAYETLYHNTVDMIDDHLYNHLAFSDKYNRIFRFQFNYHQGIIRHAQYHSFQRFGLPYIFCTDYMKIAKIIDDDNRGSKIYSMTPNFRMAYQLYRNGLEKAELARLDRPKNTTVSDPLMLVTSGLVGIFHYSDGPLIQASRVLPSLFTPFGWGIRTAFINSIQTTTPASLKDKEILILEYDPITKKNVYNLRDLIHYLHALEYTGLIVILQHVPSRNFLMGNNNNSPNPFQLTSDNLANNNNMLANRNNMNARRDTNTNNTPEIKLPPKNDYSDAISADMIIPYPLTNQNVKSIFIAYERKIIRQMILTNPKS